MTDAEVLDHVRIRAVLEDYYAAVDLRDREFLIACFTEDATATYQCGTPDENTTHGSVVIADTLLGIAGKMVNSTHGVSNMTIRIDGTSARSTTFSVIQANTGEKIIERGLRYDDELVRLGNVWKIAVRRHRALWQRLADSAPIGLVSRPG